MIVPPGKRGAVRAHLTDLSRRLGPGARLPGVRTLCAELGVSLSTVNGALAELERERLIRRRHGSGIFVAPDLLRRRIALICRPSFFCQLGASPFWGLLLHEAQRRADERGDELQIHFAPPDAELAQGRLHGVVSVGLDLEFVERIEAHGVPVVAYAGPARYTVGSNDEGLIRLGFAALHDAGCRRVARWRGHGAGSSEERLLFDALAKRAGAPSLSRDADPAPTRQEQGYRLAETVFSGPADARPDGILFPDDMLTIGALGAFPAYGVAVGTTVRLATHANVGSPVLLGWERRLIRLEVDPAAIVRTLFDRLEAALTDRPPTPGHTTVPLRLRLPEETPTS